MSLRLQELVRQSMERAMKFVFTCTSRIHPCPSSRIQSVFSRCPHISMHTEDVLMSSAYASIRTERIYLSKMGNSTNHETRTRTRIDPMSGKITGGKRLKTISSTTILYPTFACGNIEIPIATARILTNRTEVSTRSDEVSFIPHSCSIDDASKVSISKFVGLIAGYEIRISYRFEGTVSIIYHCSEFDLEFAFE